MALYAFDGTWNKDEVMPANDSNVVRFKESYEGNVFYCEGVGTRFGRLGQLIGGLTGFGAGKRISEAFDALKYHFSLGDFEIDIVGFSRGAAMALHFANEVERKYPLAPIRFVGIWDAVASFGIPGNRIDLFWYFTAATTVKNYYHAMALDECRSMFPLTRIKELKTNRFCNLLDRKANLALPCFVHKSVSPDMNESIEEAWFRGVHSDIGGGKNISLGLAYTSLCWMLSRAIKSNLPIDMERYNAYKLKMDSKQEISNKKKLDKDAFRKINVTDWVHESVAARENHNNPSAANPVSYD